VERFAHATTYTRPDAAEQIAAFRAPLNPKAAALDAMLAGGPFETWAGSVAGNAAGTSSAGILNSVSSGAQRAMDFVPVLSEMRMTSQAFATGHTMLGLGMMALGVADGALALATDGLSGGAVEVGGARLLSSAAGGLEELAIHARAAEKGYPGGRSRGAAAQHLRIRTTSFLSVRDKRMSSM
jgi:hypothetical protein